jgi:hypothetical protein
MVHWYFAHGHILCGSYRDHWQCTVAHGVDLDHLKCPMVQHNLLMVQIFCGSWKDHGKCTVTHRKDLEHLQCPMGSKG